MCPRDFIFRLGMEQPLQIIMEPKRRFAFFCTNPLNWLFCTNQCCWSSICFIQDIFHPCVRRQGSARFRWRVAYVNLGRGPQSESVKPPDCVLSRFHSSPFLLVSFLCDGHADQPQKAFSSSTKVNGGLGHVLGAGIEVPDLIHSEGVLNPTWA